MRRLALRVLLLICLGALPFGFPAATGAANGDLVAQVHFDQSCTFLGVGITFDGQDLWYSCYQSPYDLMRADPATGHVVAKYSIAGGLGAIAYDASRNAIWAGWGAGAGSEGDVRLIQLDASKAVTGASVVFNATDAHLCGLDDGLAYDATDDTLYISPDCSGTVHHFSTTGVHLDDRPFGGSGCYNSGLAIGGNLLYEGSDGCSHVWVVDKTTNAPAFDFSTAVLGDPNFRDEGLGCDPVTFAASGRDVMWSIEAYEPRRAAAFEIPSGTCGFGGNPAGEGADLSLSKTGPAYAMSGGTISYQLVVDNAGPADATNVVVTDTLPAGETLVSATASQGSCTGSVTCNLGTVANGGSATITIVATVTAASGSTLTNDASVSGDQTDDQTDNNSASASTLVYGVPAGGSFVIGDRNAGVGTAVTFWGAQWWKANSLSGGAAPASFKGFETTAPAACGLNWSTTTGNSPPPPAGPLPAYMAVIVSSSVSQSGSTISGNTPHVVIVRTDAGYDPNPGHAGTGTVFASVC